MKNLKAILNRAVDGNPPCGDDALSLSHCTDSDSLVAAAGQIRDATTGCNVTWSRKLFIPLTRLCRDVCHYCTFATTPKNLTAAYMSSAEVLAEAQRGAAVGCKEALFTLGEKPELRYRWAREALAEKGHATTLGYVAEVAGKVLKETGLLPHINAGNMNEEEMLMLRNVSASMGLMLESASERLCGRGMPHYGSPDKLPARRLATIDLAGRLSVPFTSGILIGIGETRGERIEALLALADSHRRYGHLQEVIIQNFRAKPGTLMAAAVEPDLAELLWTLAVARIVLPTEITVQVPPNLSPGVLTQLLQAGVGDWGGVSPVTPDYVNPEAPWPHLEQLRRATTAADKVLTERLTIYPAWARAGEQWLAAPVRHPVMRLSDANDLAREDHWHAGATKSPAADMISLARALPWPTRVSREVRTAVAVAEAGGELPESLLARLFNARGVDFSYLCRAADTLRAETNGNTVSYVINRNINYTNICYFKCRFCAFSKGKTAESLRGKPYDLGLQEIVARVREAVERGATEVCLQGGIHPDYTGATYLAICSSVRAAAPDIHIHAFSPLEISQGAATLGIDTAEFLSELRAEGLGTLPGTAAEILDDEVRSVICPDKLNTNQWLSVMRTAHRLGIRTTATMMFGHVDRPVHWARHLLRIAALQRETGGFTEFVPLPFVAREAPVFLRGQSRAGPSFREAVLVHAIARLVFYRLIDNIQVSWVKMGDEGVSACLQAGANDLGGTLMNESITRAAGAAHGQQRSVRDFARLADALGRPLRQRTTLYSLFPDSQQHSSLASRVLASTDG